MQVCYYSNRRQTVQQDIWPLLHANKRNSCEWMNDHTRITTARTSDTQELFIIQDSKNLINSK